jgi:uncharacterized protein (DUF433 family)
VAGGKPRITGHRITVQDVVVWHERLGLSADEIASEYGLSLADVYAALAYYYDHREEIDRAIRKVTLDARCTMGSIRASTLEQKVNETLRQIGAEVLEERAE